METERQHWFYRLARQFMRTAGGAYFGLEYLNPEHVPERGPVILASNHVSFIDPPFIGSGVRRSVHFLARNTLFHVPLVGCAIRNLNSVPVDRDGAGGPGLKAILDRLHAGNAILLFPEGTRSPDGQLQPAKAGIGLTVIKSGARVVPVRVFGAFEAYGRHLTIPRPRPIRIKYGHPLDLDSLQDEARHCPRNRLREIYHDVATRIMEGIARLEPCRDIQGFPM